MVGRRLLLMVCAVACYVVFVLGRFRARVAIVGGVFFPGCWREVSIVDWHCWLTLRVLVVWCCC